MYLLIIPHKKFFYMFSKKLSHPLNCHLTAIVLLIIFLFLLPVP